MNKSGKIGKEKLNKRKIIEKMEKNREEIKSRGVKKLGLFGSYVKGKERRGSDIDIIVSFDKPNFEKYAELLIFLESLFRKKIDLIIDKNLHPELNYVKKEAAYVKL